ncbi:hypothetical protein WJX72_007370 [[Myrmecia] bisecta]|uniref:GTPase Era n=1 Tax=[Myrmecia] bisecta TaxID=41462 RepID=A0AAW1QFH6_9CHLO
MLKQDPPGHRAGYVAIIGKPNAGKSTLLNALLGQKLSIVTAKAQTTRHRVLGILSDADYQIILLDTPGVMKEQRNKLDEKMMRNVRRAIQDADALLALVDATEPPSDILDMIQPGPDWTGPPLGLALNKTDLLAEDRLQYLLQWFQTNSNVDAVIPVSALNGTNIDAITDWAVSHMPLGPTLYPKDMVSEQPERFFVSEIIREKIFEQFREEIPYCSTVQVVKYEERAATAKDYVEVHIIVEHASQRGILLGRGGAAMKKLATASRIDIEDFIGKPVYLDISVKVAEKWRTNANLVKEYGY